MDDDTTAFYNVFRAVWEMLRQAIVSRQVVVE
jgi:hypothetical protein